MQHGRRQPSWSTVWRFAVDQLKKSNYRGKSCSKRAKKYFKNSKTCKENQWTPPKPPYFVEWKIVDLMKDRPNSSGIVWGYESIIPFIVGLSKSFRNKFEIKIIVSRRKRNRERICVSHFMVVSTVFQSFYGIKV